MAGSPLRAKAMAESVLTQTDVVLPVGTKLVPLGKTERYVLYKVGPVLSCSHGIGMPSMSILLHEVTKLLHYAKVPRDELVYIRLGTCGGLGVPPGTQVITRKSLDGLFRPEHRSHVVGKETVHTTSLDESLIESLVAAAGEDIPAVVGDTIAADDFYQEQGRVDGAFCDHTEADKDRWLRDAHDAGVRNIEMESRMFAAFCTRMKIRGAVVCAVIVNRLEGDQVRSTPGQLIQYSAATIKLVLRFVRQQMLHSRGGAVAPAAPAAASASAAAPATCPCRGNKSKVSSPAFRALTGEKEPEPILPKWLLPIGLGVSFAVHVLSKAGPAHQ